jgi:hypothetical protein
VFRPPSSAQQSLEELVDVRLVVAIAIDAEVVLRDILGHVDGMINSSNLFYE